MEITWLGHACFRVRSRDLTLVLDPPSPSTGYALSKLPADIVTVSHDHPGHNAVDVCTGSPRIIRGPGEYEVAGVLIEGVQTYHDDQQGKERGRNTAYLIELEELRICHLGDLGHIPTAEQIEELRSIDILMVPVGGSSTIGAERASEVVSLLGPRLVIPMHYHTSTSKRQLDPLEPFLKQMGLTESAPQARLTVTHSSLPPETQVAVLELRK